MSHPDEATAAALAPVRDALLAAARRDADAVRERSAAAAARTLSAARDAAAQIRAEARARGVEDAATAMASERSRARRRAHAAVLAARREEYESLRTAARSALAELRDDDGYPLLRQHMADAARRLLGPEAQLTEATDGGVIGRAAGRRLDLSLAGFADRAVDAVVADVDQEAVGGRGAATPNASESP
jgi:vacuolar-type H+-ATPase subunit E/Vma4